MKLHLGCGNIYLPPADGWINIDLKVDDYSFLAEDRPDLIAENRTTVDRYYKYPYTQVGPLLNRLCVADVFMDVLKLRFSPNVAEEILAVQILEHFSFEDCRIALAEWYRVLTPGGILTVDVPDFHGLVKEMFAQPEEERDYYYRMLFGSQKNESAFHRNGFTVQRLWSCLRDAGFCGVSQINNIFHHPYPAITMKATKVG